MKRFFLYCLFLVFALPLWADKQEKVDSITVRGKVLDNFTREIVDSTFIEILMPDTATVLCTTWNVKQKNDVNYWEWNPDGFKTKVPQYGKYLIRSTKRGYKPLITLLDIPRKKYNKRIREWETDDILQKKSNSYDFDSDMKEVTVSATRIKMLMDGDTVVYNADAFELSEGSMLDELIRQLPGVELKDGGEIYVNGNKVNELMLNGKHFFQGDAKVALDNLPAYMVQNVKAYQRADDKAYLDKHHEEMKKKDPWVIDVNLKRQYNTGWIGNTEGGYGTDKRYMGRIFLTRFTDHSRLTIYGSANNINNFSRPGTEGSWSDYSSPVGKTERVEGGIDFHVDSRLNKTEMNTHLSASRTRSTSQTDVSGVTFLQSGDVYNRSHSENENTSTIVNWELDLEVPKKESFIYIRPDFNYSYSKSNGYSQTATFNADPEDAYRGQSLDSIFAPLGSKRLEKFLVNRTLDMTKGTNSSLNMGLGSYYYFTAPWNGEMVSMEPRISYTRQENKSFSQYDLRQPAQGDKEATQDYRNRYTLSPTRKLTVGCMLSHDFFEFDFGTVGIAHNFNYTYNKGHRDLYRMDEYDEWGATANRAIGLLPSTTDSLNACIDWQNSYHTLTKDISNNTYLTLQKGGDWGYYFISLSLERQRNHIEDTRDHVDRSLTRTFTLPGAQASLKIKDWECGLSFNQGAPSMEYLLDLRDDSNPLSVSLGNANLKNSSIENFYLRYSHNSTEKQSNWHIAFNSTFNQNSIGNALTYNRETGVYTYRPENINGNWSAGINSGMSLPLDKKKLWTISHSPSFNYQRSVDFSQEVGEATGSSQTATTNDLAISRVHNYVLNDNMNLRFQKGGYTASLNATAGYTHATSKRANFHTINTIDFSYGASCSLKLPWNIQFDTDITMHSRRGYEDATMNENNLVWNAALSKSLLKSKALIIKFIGHDILQQLSGVQRNINAQGRTETWYNTQPAYGLLTLSYKLNVMPKKKKNDKE